MMPSSGLVQITSRYPFGETIDRLAAAFTERGMKVFTVIDHSGEAEQVGLRMRPTKLWIFGSARGGTPLMLAAPSLAIDLPLKALVAENEAGLVSVCYNDPEYLQRRHNVPAELIKNLSGAGALIDKAVE